jgi:hypothetical protein
MGHFFVTLWRNYIITPTKDCYETNDCYIDAVLCLDADGTNE